MKVAIVGSRRYENKKKIKDFVFKIKQQYGNPIALVHDMGKGIITSVEEVFPETPDYICHSHFLIDAGSDGLSDFSRILSISVKTCFTPPTIGTSALIVFDIDAGSISI